MNCWYAGVIIMDKKKYLNRHGFNRHLRVI
ncbi:Uncharacterised protein [Raoultella ornithinolytica]|nr:Uncharacterised protein [Raoultella ornithinolytica]